MNPFQTKKFKDLQKEWYDKLKKSGFEDAEDVNSTLQFMKQWDSVRFYRKYDVDTFQAKLQYYQMAGSFLQVTVFIDELQRMIWKLHSEGQSIRKISKIMNIKNGQVYKVIKELRHKMLKK